MACFAYGSSDNYQNLKPRCNDRAVSLLNVDEHVDGLAYLIETRKRVTTMEYRDDV